VLTAEGSTLKTDMCKLVFGIYGLEKKNQSRSYLNHLVYHRLLNCYYYKVYLEMTGFKKWNGLFFNHPRTSPPA
jgi:hypothetical protein